MLSENGPRNPAGGVRHDLIHHQLVGLVPRQILVQHQIYVLYSVGPNMLDDSGNNLSPADDIEASQK